MQTSGLPETVDLRLLFDYTVFIDVYYSVNIK